MTPLQRARIIWGAMLGSVAMYVAVLVVLVGQGAAEPAGDPSGIRVAFLALSAGEIGVILFFKRRLAPGDADPTRARGLDGERAFTAYVVCWALAEAVALHGLVLGLLARSLGEAQPFFIVGAALLLWLRPRAEHFGA